MSDDHIGGDHGKCPACPLIVRDLASAAHNAHGALEYALYQGGDWARARRKLADLGAALQRWEPVRDAHFADHWHGCEACKP